METIGLKGDEGERVELGKDWKISEGQAVIF